MSLSKIMRWFKEELDREERVHMRKVALRYDQRRHMDGEVIQKTGEIVPRESA